MTPPQRKTYVDAVLNLSATYGWELTLEEARTVVRDYAGADDVTELRNHAVRFLVRDRY